MREPLGATPHADGSCTFRVWAPHAQRVSVTLRAPEPARAGDAAEHEAQVAPLTPGEHGIHYAHVQGVRAGHRYAYLLDDDPLELPDPRSLAQPDGVHAGSAVVDLAAFAWTDAAWRGRALTEHVICELHVGTFTPEGTFDTIIARLADLAADGFTAIELMPIAEFPGGRNWGYDGVGLFAAQSTYGGADGLRRLVDAAHAAGLAVILDVVYNHFGPEGNYLARFGPYLTDHHHTPWGDAVNMDAAGSDQVRAFVLDNALGWLRDFHIDGLRLDAVHGIVDTSPTHIFAELADGVAALRVATGRAIHLFAESDLNDVRVITPRDPSDTLGGGWGCDAQWIDDFHHPLHVLLTGEHANYYADHTGGLEQLARAYRQGYTFTGQYAPARQRSHGTDSTGQPGERFVVYAQNHDQIGNRPTGDRLTATLSPGHQRLALGATLLAPFLPLMFMGEEYGSTTPFPYFVSHTDAGLLDAVRDGRAAGFAWFEGDRIDSGDQPDPADVATHAAAVLDWDTRTCLPHAARRALTRELLRLRRELPSLARLRPAELVTHLDTDAGWLALDRSADGERTLVVLAFHAMESPLADVLRACGSRPGPDWERTLDSEHTDFAGAGVDPARIVGPGVTVLRRAPTRKDMHHA